jgi:signal transduction histidine kinase
VATEVLVLAPTGRDRHLSPCAMLGREGFAADACTSIEHLCESVSDAAGALLIAEEALSPVAVQSLMATLDAQPPWSDIPLIVLAGGEFTASSTRPLNVLRPLRNVMILERPVRRLILMRTVSVALRARKRQIELQAYLEERADLLKREQLAREQAELANRMKDEFLMTVSHELRTPLTAIYGWARMLLTGELRDSQRQRAIETIERNAHAQTQLVNDLLDVSRAISGKLRRDVRAVDLNQVVLAAVDSMQPAADAKGLRLEAVLDAKAGPISGDRDRLQPVVWNLLSNAIKFTPSGGRVQVRLEQLESQMEITVSDTGSGIDPEFLPYVFDRFRQGETGTTRQHGGLGIGLSIVRHLVELHGGTVRVESGGDGGGTTFHVRLPLAIAQGHAEDAALRPAGGKDRDQPSSKRLDGLRVLIVDDEPHARELFGVIAEARAPGASRLGPGCVGARANVAARRLLTDIEMPKKGWLCADDPGARAGRGQRRPGRGNRHDGAFQARGSPASSWRPDFNGMCEAGGSVELLQRLRR